MPIALDNTLRLLTYKRHKTTHLYSVQSQQDCAHTSECPTRANTKRAHCNNFVKIGLLNHNVGFQIKPAT